MERERASIQDYGYRDFSTLNKIYQVLKKVLVVLIVLGL